MKVEYLERAASSIEDGLKGNCKGYALVVSYKDEMNVKRAGGWARLKADPPKTEMSTSVPFTLASVSKVITAAALIRVLNKKNLHLDTRIHSYLPDHWDVHRSIHDVSFKNLMEHRTGFRFGGDGEYYHDVKRNMEAGMDSSLRGTFDYSNHNYDVIRLLIPRLAGYKIEQYKKDPGPAEIMQAAMYAGYYVDYVQKEVFGAAGLSNFESISCKALPFVTGKCYKFPYNGLSGTDFGDVTLESGAQGWVMSAAQLSKFIRRLHFTDRILSKEFSDYMIKYGMGYDHTGDTPGGISSYWKGGSYSSKQNAGALKSLVIGFGNNVNVALIINSDFTGPIAARTLINEAIDNMPKTIKIK